MNILFDYQIFEEQKTGGISRYFYELYKSFKADKDIEIQLSVNFSDNIYLNSLPEYSYLSSGLIHPYQKFLPWLKFKGKSKLYSVFSRAVYAHSNLDYSLSIIRKSDYDVFHPSYYYTYYQDVIKDKPLVITVHDMISEIYPEYFPSNSLLSVYKRQLTKRADKIIAVSENTKHDLIKIFDVNPEKIDVIYHGNSLDISKLDQNNEFLLPKTYLLYVGSRMIYKNFNFFIESVKNLLVKTPELKIICTGSPFSDAEKASFRINNIENNLMHFFATDVLLARLYLYATAFIFPSLYEGFGIPVLEAFSCGCPCLLSNTSSLTEVGGDAAIYFNPKSSESIQEAVNKVLFNESLRKEMQLKGYNQIKKFSWSKTAKETKAVYKKLM